MLARLVARERVALAPVAALAHRTAHRGGAFARGGRVRQLSATTAADVTPWLQSAGVPKAAAVPLSVAFVHFRASPTWFQYSTAVAGAAGVVSFIIDARKKPPKPKHAPPQRHNTYGPTSTAAALRTLDTVHEPAEPEPEPAATAAAAPAAGDAAPGAAAAAAALATAAAAAAAAAARDIVRSADGTVQAFSDGAGALWVRRGAGATAEPLVAAATLGGAPRLVGFTADGQFLVVAAAAAGGAEHVYAVAVADGTPRDLTPDADGVDAIAFGKGADVLVAIETPAAGAGTSWHRCTAPDGPLILDTLPPPGGGAVQQWLVDDGHVVGAVVERADGATVLMMRGVEPARYGGPAWLATCKRLGLPLPPADPASPALYAPWEAVAEWDAADGTKVLGVKEGLAWLLQADQAVAVAADGAHFEVPLK